MQEKSILTFQNPETCQVLIERIHIGFSSTYLRVSATDSRMVHMFGILKRKLEMDPKVHIGPFI